LSDILRGAVPSAARNRQHLKRYFLVNQKYSMQTGLFNSQMNDLYEPVLYQIMWPIKWNCIYLFQIFSTIKRIINGSVKGLFRGNQYSESERCQLKCKINAQFKSSQVYLYSAFHSIDCIKAASQYQSKHNNNVHFLVEKHSRLVELINGINDWLINLNIPNWVSQWQQRQGTEKLHQVT